MTKPTEHGLEPLAALISFRVGGWHDFGYETPPAPDCKAIPPLGERSARAIKSGHDAVKAIDELTRHLYMLRSQLVDELRRDEDIRMARCVYCKAPVNQDGSCGRSCVGPARSKPGPPLSPSANH